MKKSLLLILLVITLFCSMGIKEWSFGNKENKDQKNLQEGNRLYRNFEYYKAAKEFEKAGTIAIPYLNNILNNFKDVYEAQEAVHKSPKDFEVNLALAKVYHKRYNSFSSSKNPLAEHYLTLTEEQYKKSAGLGANRFEPHRGLGDLYFSVKRWDAAADSFNKVLAIAADDHESRKKLSICYLSMGQLDQARSESTRILSADPGCGKCYEILGQIDDKKHLTDQAMQNYQKALRYDASLQTANRRVNEIEDARTPKGYIKVSYNKTGSAKETWGMSDVDSGTQSSVGVYGSSSSSSRRASGSGSYDTTNYGSGSYEASGEASSESSSAAMWGDAYSNMYACSPDDIEVFAYNKTTKRKYFMEDAVRTPIPEGSYTFYAAFLTRCDKQFGDPYKATEKTIFSQDFNLNRGQNLNLEVQMQADMHPENCGIKVVRKKEVFMP